MITQVGSHFAIKFIAIRVAAESSFDVFSDLLSVARRHATISELLICIVLDCTQ